MKHTLALILALTVTPALAVNTKPEPPQKETPKEQPARESKPEPKSEPETRSSREPERESECPYTRKKEHNWACVGFRPKPRPERRPVTNQTVPAGEKFGD